MILDETVEPLVYAKEQRKITPEKALRHLKQILEAEALHNEPQKQSQTESCR